MNKRTRTLLRYGPVEMLMRRSGLQGVTGRPRYRRIPNMPTAGDLVDRQFHRSERNRLWVTDITSSSKAARRGGESHSGQCGGKVPR